MAGVYHRNFSLDPARPRIPWDQFQALVAEYARGAYGATNTGVNGAAMNTLSDKVAFMTKQTSEDPGTGLNANERQDVLDLINTVLSGGNITNRMDRQWKIAHVFLLADQYAPGYSTPAEVATALGVTLR
jgi:hypothetical protein